MSQVSVSKFKYNIVTHPERHLFSCRCSKSQHAMCSGTTKRGDGKCKCPCHKVVSHHD